jgi:poly-gamma-glutamate synthesis protein (capsule biosynthesis protein)
MISLGDRRRVLVHAFGMESSGIPAAWAATEDRLGVDVVPDLSRASADRVVERVRAELRPGDLVVASVHWGSNWGYGVGADQVRFAHRLVDGGVDVVHGHSSHHPRPIEVYRGRLVLYGCGDLVDDYEGIRGYERYRDDLRLLYLVSLHADTGRLSGLRLVPLQARRMRLCPASPEDAEWLRGVLERASRRFGTRLERAPDGALAVRSEPAGPDLASGT